MATKSAKKSSKSSKKAGAKSIRATSTKAIVGSKIPGSPFHPLYGRPILDAIRRNNPAEMRQIRTIAQRHVREVEAALAKLEARLNRG